MIRCLVIFAEGIFKGESQVIHPNENSISSQISVTLKPPKDLAIDLHLKALIGYKSSFHFHVFELSRHLPRFAMYAVNKNVDTPQSYVTFTMNEKIPRVVCIYQSYDLIATHDIPKVFVLRVAVNVN